MELARIDSFSCYLHTTHLTLLTFQFKQPWEVITARNRVFIFSDRLDVKNLFNSQIGAFYSIEMRQPWTLTNSVFESFLEFLDFIKNYNMNMCSNSPD